MRETGQQRIGAQECVDVTQRQFIRKKERGRRKEKLRLKIIRKIQSKTTQTKKKRQSHPRPKKAYIKQGDHGGTTSKKGGSRGRGGWEAPKQGDGKWKQSWWPMCHQKP